MAKKPGPVKSIKPIKKIGSYLSLNRHDIETVLSLQEDLGSHGVAKLFGEILVENGTLSPQQLGGVVEKQRIDIMKACAVFRSIRTRDLKFLSSFMEDIFIASGSEFVVQDTAGDCLYVLIHGRVCAYWIDEYAGRVELGVIGPGGLIGEMDYFLEGRRTATYRSEENVRLLKITYKDLRNAFGVIPVLAANFLEHLHENNLRFQEIIKKACEAERAIKSYQSFLNLSEIFDLRITIEELLVKNVTMASKIMEAERASLFLVDKTTSELWSRVAEGSGMREIRIPMDRGIAGWVAQNEKILNIEDAYQDKRFNPEIDKRTGYRTRSILCGPVINLEGELLGVVQVINKKNAVFSEQDEKVFRILCQQIAISLDNFYLSKKVMSNYEKVAMLLDISNVAAQTMDLKLLIPNIVNKISQILGAERTSLFLLDRSRNELWSKAAQDLEISEIRFPSSKGIAGNVLSTGKALNIRNAYEDPRFNPAFDQQTGFNTRNMLCVPVLNRTGEIIGVTQVMNKSNGAFTDEDQDLLRALSSQVSMALENATLFDQIFSMKNYLENIQQSISNPIVSLDVNYRIVTANRSFYRLFRIVEGSVTNKDFIELLGEANQSFIGMIHESASTGKPHVEFDIALSVSDDDRHTVNVNIAPLLSDKNDYEGVVIVIEDITEERRLKGTLTRYMSKAIVDRVLGDADRQKLGGIRNKASILFSDIRGFTALTEKLSAAQTMDFVNECFSIFVDILFKYNGVLDKYIGDAIMAVFGVPYEHEDDAVRAVRCALDMHAVLDIFNQGRISEGKEPVMIGVGISTGEVLSGNIGSEKRMDFTVIGDDVNVSFYLEKQNKIFGTKILISESTKIETSGFFTTRLLDQVVFKGKTKPVRIYEVLGDKSCCLTEYQENFNHGFDLYQKRCFSEARKLFFELSEKDPPSRVFLNRCMHFLKNPPPPNWNGVWVDDFNLYIPENNPSLHP